MEKVEEGQGGSGGGLAEDVQGSLREEYWHASSISFRGP